MWLQIKLISSHIEKTVGCPIPMPWLTHSGSLCWLACRAATMVPHFCLFCASFWMDPRCDGGSWALLLQFKARCSWVVLVSASPRVVQDMLPGSLLITCQIHLYGHHMMQVPMLSWLQWAKGWLEMVSGQNSGRILLRFNQSILI